MGTIPQQWKNKGALAPLFDRLRDPNPLEDEPEPLANYDQQQVLNSIQVELTKLLNTRCTLTKKEYDALNPATLQFGLTELYGLSDFSFFNPSAKTSWPQSAQLIKNAIRLFEPRLNDVVAEIRSFNPQRQEMYVDITANAIIGDYIIPVNFPVAITNIPINKTDKTR